MKEGTKMANLQNFMAKKFYGKLKNGKYCMTFEGYAYIAETATTTDYYVFSFHINEGPEGQMDRPYKRTMFENDLTFFFSGIRAQQGKENLDITPISFLQELQENKTPFNIWIENKTITRPDGSTKDVQNMYYREPKETTEVKEIE